MRLSADQVKQAILHQDRDVRGAAVYYFARSFSTDPSIMPLAIQAIERYGWKDAFEFYSFVKDLVQTDETVLWLIAQVKKNGEPDEEYGYVDALQTALVYADSNLLQQHDEAILSLDHLDEKSKDGICQRVRLASQPPDDLWFQLEEFCRRSDKLNTVPQDLDLADNLVEALGRHPEFSAPKVLAILDKAPAENWLELCAVRLAGELRLQEAIPAIIALHNDADDWIFEDGHRALVKIGGDRVVEELALAYPIASDDLRSVAASVMESIHTDLSVETCLKFFETEKDHHTRCSLIQSALLNFAPEAIETARQLILKTPLDPEVIEVRTDLLTACKVIGERFPEFDEWTEAAKQDTEFRKDWYKKLLPNLDEFELDDEEFNQEDFDDEEFDEPSPEPIVRHSHVGRNDPCPCGSGKKFKKCCLKEQEPKPTSTSQKQAQYPIGTVALYGPNDTVTTKIVAAVIRRPGADPELERWMGTNVAHNPKVQRKIKEFFDQHEVTSVVATDRNMGCPHEEGLDFPHGEDCPFCPFWAGKQGSNRRD